jgi:diguanylate cyclase (GGDEF)-like protein/PAS domain S-box-containing protein
LLAVACYLGGRIGLAIPHAGNSASALLIWPPSGIALAVLLRLGRALWPGVWMGSFFLLIGLGVPAGAAALVASGDTLGPLLGASILRRAGLRVELDRRRDLWLYCFIGVGYASLLTASNATLWLAVGGSLGWNETLRAWIHGWEGNALGALLVGIPLLTLSRASLRQAFGSWRAAPSSLIALAALASAALIFGLPAQAQPTRSVMMFVPHVLLGWLAVRSGLFAPSATTLLLSAGVATATASGLGPFRELDAGPDFGLLAVGYVCSLLAVPLLATALIGDLAASERRWQLALASSGIGVAEWNLVTGRISFSAHWQALLGHAAQDASGDLEAFWSLIHPDDTGRVQQAFEPLRTAGMVNCTAQSRIRTRDGGWHWFELNARVAEHAADGAPARILTTARDIRDLQAARERQHLSDSLFQNLHEGLVITDAQHRVLEVNPTFVEITGYSREELLGTVPSLLRAGSADPQAEAQQAALCAGLEDEGLWRGEVLDRRRNGETCLLQLTASVVRGTGNSAHHHVLAITDITGTRQQLEQLQRQAHFDELTRLPNRVRLAQMLQEAMQTSRRERSLLTVCYLDLDHFKPVNDRFGHDAGDRLLLELANRMRRSLRSWAGGDDVVARIGGDEFVLLLRTATVEESRHAVERLLHQVSQPYGLGVGAGPVTVTASIGATVFPMDAADPETLLRHADHALYGAKQAGRNGYLFFDAEHDRRAEARFVALGRVQEALDAEEFRLFFQPKVDMRSGKVLGFEALLRWKHPEQGVVAPAHFLPLVENTGLSASVGDWVLQRGIEQLARWLRLGLDITVSVNVSARHLQEPGFAQRLTGLLSRHQAPVAHRLVLEVLETAALADVDYTCTLMQECRALGVRFALDDFGTGYSTFTYLKRLPIDMLKIDRSFVFNMLSDRQDMAIVEGVIGLSRTFDCSVVAEGVETPEQAQRLIEIGCDVGQGNGIAAAMPADEVASWVRDYRGMMGSSELLTV